MDTSNNTNTLPESQPSSPDSPATARSTRPTYPHWHDFIAGAAAGVGARAITAPLDLLKIRRQLAPPSSSTKSSASSSASSAAIKSKATFIGGEWNIFHSLSSIAEKEGGVLSLYRGNVAASYLWMGYSVAQFWLYGYTSEYLRQQYTSFYGNANVNSVKVSGAISFTSGAISGVCATVITYPFDLCRTIFAARGIFPIAASNVTWSNHTTELAAKSQQQYYDAQRRPPKTMQDFANRMYQQKGFRGFYAGSAPGLLQIVPYMGINFALHDVLVMLSESTDSRVSGVAGMGAGVISKLLVYPLDTVKKRMQAQAFWGSSPSATGTARKSTKYTTALPQNSSMYSNKKIMVGAVNNRGVRKQQAGPVVYEGMVDCFRQIGKREGLAAFYKGLVPSLLKSSVSTGASFWLFTLTKNVLRSIHDSDPFWK